VAIPPRPPQPTWSLSFRPKRSRRAMQIQLVELSALLADVGEVQRTLAPGVGREEEAVAASAFVQSSGGSPGSAPGVQRRRTPPTMRQWEKTERMLCVQRGEVDCGLSTRYRNHVPSRPRETR